MFTKLGIGDESKLGEISFKDTIVTYSESEMVPRIIVFWNNAVKACVEGSELLDALSNLEKAGVKILVASHALNELNLKASLRVGLLANHLDLIDAINRVQKVVTF